MEQSRCATGMKASSTKIWCCGRAWSRPQRQGRTASLPSTEEPSLPRTIRGGKAMRKEESSCCWIERKCQHSLGTRGKSCRVGESRVYHFYFDLIHGCSAKQIELNALD